MKIFAVLILVIIQGCSFYTSQRMERDTFFQKPTSVITKVVYETGEAVQFNNKGANYYNIKASIAGFDADGNYIVIPVNAIEEVLARSGRISLSEVHPYDTTMIVQVSTNKPFNHERGLENSYVYTFARSKGGGKYYKDTVLIAGTDSEYVSHQLSTEGISYFEVQKFDYAKSCFADLGIVVLAGAVVVVIAAATKESCPFIYSFDGNKYIFDKEPLGGATMEILQRSEFSKLRYLKESEGKYKLLVTNEVEETQFIDKLKLVYVDHEKGEVLYPDVNNNVYTLKNLTLPAAACDGNGKNLMPFIKADDGVYWKSKMAENESDMKKDTRENVYFTFNKPKDASQCNLVLNAGTTLWGSNMIKEMLLLYGSGVDDYYKRVNEGGYDYQAMMNYLQNEELFQLKLYAKVKGEWKYKTTVNGSGPFKTETRVYPFDISDVEGDTIYLKVEPPVGFWTFDYAAVNYEPVIHPQCISLDAIKTSDQDSKGINQLLDKEDKKYYALPDTSHYFYAEFDAPAMIEGKVRTIFANTTGWYQIHVPKTGDANITQLMKFITAPGSIVKYSNDKYIEWVKQY